MWVCLVPCVICFLLQICQVFSHIFFKYIFSRLLSLLCIYESYNVDVYTLNVFLEIFWDEMRWNEKLISFVKFIYFLLFWLGNIYYSIIYITFFISVWVFKFSNFLITLSPCSTDFIPPLTQLSFLLIILWIIYLVNGHFCSIFFQDFFWPF